MRRDFATYFDRNYLSRGLALYHSLRRNCDSFRLFILCLDEVTYDYLTGCGFLGIVPIRLSALESADPELYSTRNSRTRIEYYFTLTPAWLRFLFETHHDIGLLTYVDSDFYFFSSPEPLFAEMGNGSVAVVEHRFPPALKVRESYGRFNVGWLSFRRDEEGLACVNWWRERCIEWCYDRVEGDRFADQKYLDAWPARYHNLIILEHPGVSVAPWNFEESRFGFSESPTIDGQPLICFHYHGLKHLVGPLYESGLGDYSVRLTKAVRAAIFTPYLRELLRFEVELNKLGITSGAARSIRGLTGSWSDLKKRAFRLGNALAKRSFLFMPRPV